jgi:hypothetical protein
MRALCQLGYALLRTSLIGMVMRNTNSDEQWAVDYVRHSKTLPHHSRFAGNSIDTAGYRCCFDFQLHDAVRGRLPHQGWLSAVR